MRQIILDTETTGLEHTDGHKIIEIGCVELINRQLTTNNYHQYINPDREIDQGAIEVHGISNEYLADKPRFPQIMQDFVNYVDGAELIIHNAPFDVGFINAELRWAGYPGQIEDHCTILDSLAMARKMYPGQRNSLDALCKRLEINNAHRTLHGALLDSEILADVYLLMTGGQTDLMLISESELSEQGDLGNHKLARDRVPGVIIKATEAELSEHSNWLKKLASDCAEGCVWEK